MAQKIEYYDFAADKAAFPDAWLYVVYSGRGPGKTYSTLWDCIKNDIKFGYIKRTQDDIALIQKPEFSPFKPINRDKGTDIQIESIGGGLTKIVDAAQDDKPVCGYAMAMSAVHKYKGFDLSEIDELIFDEFIPQKSERVNRREGELLLDLYMTISRDRVQRGRSELKLILLANSTQLACPVLLTLGLVDRIAQMQQDDDDYIYDADQGIFIRHVKHTPAVDEDMGIMRTMAGSIWADSNASGNFAYNDFSAVQRRSLKGSYPVCGFTTGRDKYIVWRNKSTGIYYCCGSNTNNDIPWYNLDSEIDARGFYMSYGIDFKNAIINDKMFFSQYSGYDIIANFQKKFSV